MAIRVGRRTRWVFRPYLDVTSSCYRDTRDGAGSGKVAHTMTALPPSQPRMRDTIIDWVGSRLDRSILWRFMGILIPAVAGGSFGIGTNVHGRAVWWWDGVAIALLIVYTILDWLRELYRGRLRQIDETAAATLVVSLRDALRPIAEEIADMQPLARQTRRERANGIARRSADALKLVMKDVHDLRCVVYRANDQGNVLNVLEWVGRSGAPPPREFRRGDERGDAAFHTIEQREPCFVRDVNDQAEIAALPGVYRGTRSGYRTFISAPIVDSGHDYGMVTVDAPEPGDLLLADKHLVMLAADMLAIAFASVR